MTEHIMVTGGAGYIGSHVCKRLSQAGFVPVTFDNLSTGRADAVRWGPLEPGDLLDADRLADVLHRYEPVAVVHLAALALVEESVAEPGRYFDCNVKGTHNLIEAMLGHDVRRLIFSSSAAVYGEPSQDQIPESAPTSPVNPYGWSKLMAEHLLASYASTHGLECVSFRYFNAAGADPDGEARELRSHETHLIPLALQVAAGDRAELTVFGRDYPTPDGTCIRDYIHVCDVADAHVRALDALTGGFSTPEVFNLGCGEGCSVQQVLTAVAGITGRELVCLDGNRRSGDPAILVADSSRVRRRLGWEPRLSGLQDMIATGWSAYNNHN